MKHLLLAFLERGPTYGLALKQQYDGLVGVVAGDVNVGQIYTTLGRLEKDGLIEHTTEPSSAGPDRKVYALTPVGAKELQRWIETTPAAPELKSEALTKIVAALELQRPEVLDLIRGHRGQCLEALRALDLAASDAEAGGPLDALVQAAALHLQADLRWLDHIEAGVRRRSDPDRTPEQVRSERPKPKDAR